MTDTPDRTLTLDEAIRRFTTAEDALRALMASAEQLSSATSDLRDAEASISSAEGSLGDLMRLAQGELEKAEKSLADASSSVYNLASELKDTARSLKDTAVAFRSLEPDALFRQASANARLSRAILVAVLLALVVSAVAAVGVFTR